MLLAIRPATPNFAADLRPFTRRRVSDRSDCLEDTASLLAKPQRQKSESPRQSSQAVRRCTVRQGLLRSGVRRHTYAVKFPHEAEANNNPRTEVHTRRFFFG